MNIGDVFIINMDDIEPEDRWDDICAISHWDGKVARILDENDGRCYIESENGKWWLRKSHLRKMMKSMPKVKWRD